MAEAAMAGVATAVVVRVAVVRVVVVRVVAARAVVRVAAVTAEAVRAEAETAVVATAGEATGAEETGAAATEQSAIRIAKLCYSQRGSCNCRAKSRMANQWCHQSPAGPPALFPAFQTAACTAQSLPHLPESTGQSSQSWRRRSAAAFSR